MESVLKYKWKYQSIFLYIRNCYYIHFPRVRILSPTFQQELFFLKKAITQVTEVDCSPILILRASATHASLNSNMKLLKIFLINIYSINFI
nr:MAG TPA: hypothetical protein [Caudoviricetes sp.]